MAGTTNPVKTQPTAFPAQSNTRPETNWTLPWGLVPEFSWLGFRCWTDVELDPGMVLHKPLPQTNPQPDTLAKTNCQSPTLDTDTFSGGGVNLSSRSTAVDVVQRMASSTYRYILRGYGLRAGYQIPIPGLYLVNGIKPVPVWPQRATNYVVGNFSGVPIWFAIWELHYVVTEAVGAGSGQPQLPVPFNPALHIRSDAQLPTEIALPLSLADPDHRGARVLRTRPTPFNNPLGGK